MNEIYFPPRELAVMSVLWRLGSASVTDVRDALEEDLAYTSVLSALQTLEEGARLAQRIGASAALVRAAFAADRGFMRLDAGAPEYLATVEAALAVTDPADVATYARLRGAKVLWGRASEAAGAPPFWPWAEPVCASK